MSSEGYVAKGDPITVVWIRDDKLIAMLTHVTKVGPTGDFAVRYPNGTDNCGRTKEGIEWIRGHHTPDSPAVLAMRAARGL